MARPRMVKWARTTTQQIVQTVFGDAWIQVANSSAEPQIAFPALGDDDWPYTVDINQSSYSITSECNSLADSAHSEGFAPLYSWGGSDSFELIWVE